MPPLAPSALADPALEACQLKSAEAIVRFSLDATVIQEIDRRRNLRLNEAETVLETLAHFNRADAEPAQIFPGVYPSIPLAKRIRRAMTNLEFSMRGHCETQGDGERLYVQCRRGSRGPAIRLRFELPYQSARIRTRACYGEICADREDVRLSSGDLVKKNGHSLTLGHHFSKKGLEAMRAYLIQEGIEEAGCPMERASLAPGDAARAVARSATAPRKDLSEDYGPEFRATASSAPAVSAL